MTKEELKPIDVSKYTVTESGNVIKDNLKQEAEEYANNLVFVFETDIVQRIVRERVRLALIDVLEPREKQIEIDAEQIRALQKQNGELTDKVNELEAQLEREKNLNQCLSDHNEQLRELIEKMKCCYNCKHSRTEYEHCRTDKSENWEIKEK